MMLKNRRKAKFYRRKYSMILTFTFILMMFSIGYAVISTTLSVNGTSKMANATWNVHFDNIQILLLMFPLYHVQVIDYLLKLLHHYM